MKPFDVDQLRYRDKFISGLLSSLKNKSIFEIDMSLQEELEGYLDLSKGLKSKAKRIPSDPTPETLKMTAYLESKTKSYKSRVREIDIKFLKYESALNKVKGKATDYIRSAYTKQLAEIKPIAAQEAIINSALSELNECLDDAAMVREIAEKVIADLTDTHYSLMFIKEVCEDFLEAGKGRKGKANI